MTPLLPALLRYLAAPCTPLLLLPLPPLLLPVPWVLPPLLLELPTLEIPLPLLPLTRGVVMRSSEEEPKLTLPLSIIFLLLLLPHLVKTSKLPITIKP
jgi:hypothetical protein